MKKIFKKIAIIIVILVAGLDIYFGFFHDKIQYWKYEDNLFKEAQSGIYFEYGKEKEIDKMISIMAQAEGWNLGSQYGLELIQTNNVDIPFITSVEYIFTHPEDKNLHHILRDTYIYDNNYGDWVPLSSTLDEYKDNKIKSIRSNFLWQGDYKIPFFKINLTNNFII